MLNIIFFIAGMTRPVYRQLVNSGEDFEWKCVECRDVLMEVSPVRALLPDLPPSPLHGEASFLSNVDMEVCALLTCLIEFSSGQ